MSTSQLGGFTGRRAGRLHRVQGVERLIDLSAPLTYAIGQAPVRSRVTLSRWGWIEKVR